MLNTATPFEVAIIDEIQMLRDISRGWAWTRALLGVCAEEVHLCGEYAAIELVKQLLYPIGEEVEIRNYKRMTPLKLSDKALETFNNIRPGDCIVAFNKNDIYQISRQVFKVCFFFGTWNEKNKFCSMLLSKIHPLCTFRSRKKVTKSPSSTVAFHPVLN